MYKNPREHKRQCKIKMEMENNICEDCGEEAKEVHHIDKTKHNHQIDNLKALCFKCHRTYHRGPYKMIAIPGILEGIRRLNQIKNGQGNNDNESREDILKRIAMRHNLKGIT